jgi:integrase
MRRGAELPHLKSYVKDGIHYVYHRPTQTQLCPKYEYKSPEFLAAYGRLEKKGKGEPIRSDRNTFGFIVRAYRTSPFFAGLKPRTQKDYTRFLNWLAPLDEMPLNNFDRSFVSKLRDKAYRQHKWHFANDIVGMCSIVFEHALEKGFVNSNPAKGVRKIERPAELGIPNRAWTMEERDAVMKAAPPPLALPIAFGRWTGLREGDVLALPRTAYKDGHLTWPTKKKGVPLISPVARPLAEMLEKVPQNSCIRLCANSYGRAWTESGFRSSFFKFLKKLEKNGLVGEGLTFHGLRTTFAEELRELGFDDRTIADAMTHANVSSVSTYLRSADRKRSARRAVEAMNEALDKKNQNAS